MSLHGACGNCSFDWLDPFTMNFTKGNYTIFYTGEILENHLQGNFDDLYNVTVILPAGVDVRNPVLGMQSSGAAVRENGTSLDVTWNDTRSFDVRYYTPERERLLLVFAVLWLVGLVLVLIPYLMERKGPGKGP